MATIRRKKSESFAILSSPGPWPQVLINWLATLAVIIVFGLIMLFSASYTTGYLRMGDSFYYIKSQVFCLGLGLAVMLLFSRIDHRFLRRMVGPGYVVCIVMLIAVLFSAPLNGCRRWLRIGFTIQVSEIAKFEMILLTAHLAAKAPHLEKLDPASGRRVPAGQWLYQRIVRELIVPLLPLIPVVFLLMLEPHMSGIVLTTAICGTILLLGGSGGIITWAGGASAVLLLRTVLEHIDLGHAGQGPSHQHGRAGRVQRCRSVGPTDRSERVLPDGTALYIPIPAYDVLPHHGGQLDRSGDERLRAGVLVESDGPEDHGQGRSVQCQRFGQSRQGR